MQTKRPVVVKFMKADLEAIKWNLDNKAHSKNILAGYTGITDDDLLEIAYDVYILKIRSKVSYPVNIGEECRAEINRWLNR